MNPSPSEKRFEKHIERELVGRGYESVSPTEYDKSLCLLPTQTLHFIKSSQPKGWEKLVSQYGVDTEGKVLNRISTEIGKRGVVDVLRNGVSDRGVKLNLTYFQPKSGLNEEHQRLFSTNRFQVVRQVRYSLRNENSLDMVLFLNGIPLLTMELKNQLTNQNIKDSENQYRKDRNPIEPLFGFKRCVVHFCVDNDEVSMTTRLMGDKTHFLPYNKEISNPPNPNGYRTHYLWEEILTPESLLDILENFVHISVEEEKEWNSQTKRVEPKKKEILIFPRYHQLSVIRSLRETIVKEGVGNNYLIQHTTGSGKSYSIGWLSHLLTSLYRNPTDTKRMFDTIIVITDRKVLDKQLQKTIGDLGQTIGVVNPVDVNSTQLREYLEKGKDIIITTIQKFPIISETITGLKSRTFGIIIDEVHSSQSGENSKHLKRSLSMGEVKENEDGEVEEWGYEDEIREEIRSRGKQPHISFFGFTGTPKNKTLELFGRKGEDGKFRPFHTYSMKQSIFEGFTLDVLQHYTTYKRWFKVVQDGEDKELPEGKVKRELVNFVDSHTETISQKVGIILTHFTSKTQHTIGGRGRGMVVVRSRYHCVLFFKEMVKQMREKGLPYSCLVGFSGSIRHGGMEHTEETLNRENGLGKGVSIPDGLKDPRYRILIVSNKFQTGYDEHLLQSMFVDKKLGGVQCVQTLSRLNRTTKGKTDTFVLDFVNEPEGVVESFQPYYTSTYLEGETDPNKLYDLDTEIRGFNLIQQGDVDEFCELFYSERETDERLQPPLQRVVSEWEGREEEEREKFRSTIQSYIRLYGYISQIISFEDVELEKKFVFLKYLNKKLPKRDSTRVDISDSVDLESLRIQKIGEHKLELENTEGVVEPISPGGKPQTDEPTELLSQIIQQVNQLYGVGLNGEDVGNIKQRMWENPTLQKVMRGDNSEVNKRNKWEEELNKVILSYVNERFDFYQKMENPRVKNIVSDVLYRGYVSSISR